MATFKGKTVSEASTHGLTTLNVKRDAAEINVLISPKKGFFGLGQRDAEVEVISKKRILGKPQQQTDVDQPKVTHYGSVAADSPRESDITPTGDQQLSPAEIRTRQVKNYQRLQDGAEALLDYLIDILQVMGIDTTGEIQVKSHRVKIDFKTDTEGLLIGKHGKTINALQNMAQVYLNQHGITHVDVILDVANYRDRRRETLNRLADKTARETVATGQPVYLDPMPSFERRVIHEALAENDFVNTYSNGKEPHRIVVVTPK